MRNLLRYDRRSAFGAGTTLPELPNEESSIRFTEKRLPEHVFRGIGEVFAVLSPVDRQVEPVKI
jgi:hypothetical protein